MDVPSKDGMMPGGDAPSDIAKSAPSQSTTKQSAPSQSNDIASSAVSGDTVSGDVANKAGRTKKKPSKARLRKRLVLQHRLLRFAVQIVFFIFAPGVFISAMNGIHYICSQVGKLQGIEAVSFVLTLAWVLLYTVLFGRFFCGYACAFGAMGDVLYVIGTPLRKKLRISSLDGHPRAISALRFVKYLVLLAVGTACFFDVWSYVSPYNPWTAFGVLNSGSLEGLNTIGMILLLLIMVLQLLSERSFCRFLCPMGAAFSLMPVLPFMVFGRKRKRCGKRPCNRCIDACPAGIYPDRGTCALDECFQCGRCADVCPLSNVNMVLIERGEKGEDKAAMRVAKEKAASEKASAESKYLAFRGNAWWWVLVKAFLLFVLFYFLGALRYI